MIYFLVISLNVVTSKIYNNVEFLCSKKLGTMGFEDAAGSIPPGRGTLYKLNDTGCFQNLDPVLPGVSVSNGLAWNEDGTRMYYIDSPTKQISLFDYDPITAFICNFVFNFFYLLSL